MKNSKLFLLSFSLLTVMSAKSAFAAGVFQNELAAGDATIETLLSGGAVYESNTEKIILIQAFEIKSKEQFQKLVQAALNLKKEQSDSLPNLLKSLSNAKKFSKKTDIAIINADRLKLTLGAKFVDDFAQVVNDASEVNANVSLTYWQ